MSYSDYGASVYDATESRPDKALVVKCTYDEALRKITFNSTRTCTYELLRQRVEQCFSLFAIPFAITYTDDDGEVTDIATDSDLTEAIRYVYPVHDDPPVSSSSSILSGRSLIRGKITLRVRITVEYDGPSLSDTSSLVSLDEYSNRNGSELSLNLESHPPEEVEDDSVTVSSKDMGSKYDVFRARGPKTVVSAPSREPLLTKSPPQSTNGDGWELGTVSSIPQTLDSDVLGHSSYSQAPVPVVEDPFRDEQAALEPSAVFERLKLEEDLHSKQPGSSYGSSTLHSERGAAWLRDQNARTMKSMLGDLPSPSEKSYEPSTNTLDEMASVLSGELALQQDSSGKYYFAYTAGSSYAASQSDGASDINHSSIAANPSRSRPTSMEVGHQEFQEEKADPGPSNSADLHRSSSASSSSANASSSRDSIAEDFPANYIHPDVPPEVLQYITAIPPAPPQNPPHCSQCGVVLDTIRYVCSTCGEKQPKPSVEARTEEDVRSKSSGSKGKDRASPFDLENGHGTEHDWHLFPPSSASHKHTPSPSPSTSDWSLLSSSAIPMNTLSQSTLSARSLPKTPPPLPARPSALSTSFSSSTMISATNGAPASSSAGYELCWQCLPTAGVTHALEMSVAPGMSPGLSQWPMTPEATQRAMSQWRRSAPTQKGQLRHAYVEKSWGHKGWQDVEQDEHSTCSCSTCGTAIVNHRYKCASCENFNLCKACYSQVHEIHPSHAFLVVPDKNVRLRAGSASTIAPMMPTMEGERSLKHPGVKCMHCMQDIVGARFHCAICDSVDICSNCESAGLPGNLDSSDGGHNSSHIMIKIPYPLPTAELQSASQRAKSLWSGRDAATGQRVKSRRNSLMSAYDRTVIGTGCRSGGSSLDNASMAPETEDHGVRCDACDKRIIGVRYQCATCVSVPKPFNLCATCETRSYLLHDPMHVFFQIPRPVDRPLQVEYPLVPRIYKIPAGPPDGSFDPDHPREYLKHLLHSTAVCDRCMTKINGEWFRCGYCSLDLCEVCHTVDTHNDNHVFVIFKSPRDTDGGMSARRRFSDINEPQPIIPYPIYHIL
ncbi:uncharacterized protein LAESUDRAFT_743006 [Laetiporus sulphureus 93-53]|uniref:ZZ-type domain-containing protein n=1 Tax=Laetiporus sulphureus 93-53 TaxID=1314785 RepID=A0A165EKU8_9APHY|nr:uncharacterized protein LAESUDRAFT_743006 [Laetiporus sulphureus 93-53]KZT07269.1 hypothetical protein LAESUDRAFT_743006 [Laetiporus sulphureus 93-53]